jgi:hypothetical protein
MALANGSKGRDSGHPLPCGGHPSFLLWAREPVEGDAQMHAYFSQAAVYAELIESSVRADFRFGVKANREGLCSQQNSVP